MNFWNLSFAGNVDFALFGTDADLNFDFSGATDGDFSINTSDFFVDTSASSIGIGITAPNAFLEILGTTEQLRLSYDSSNYLSFTIDANGELTFSDSGTDIATFGATGASFEVPASFNAVGDVSIAYDIQFTNQTSANIKSDGPLTIEVRGIF